ncbi:MAG: SoxR reducing system RseC family protein [Deltaproteobacteria bacterium]|nr:MAG: SoxR reducing system RseC family protein [Deltaproteobacteria bacterium]
MATEEGVVIKINATSAWVKTTRTGACKACSARGSCSTIGGGKEMEVEAVNDAGARVGDRIVLSFETASLLKACFFVYVFPILLLILGAAVGFNAAPLLDLNASGLSAVCGFSSLLLAFWFVKSRGNRMARNKKYRPKIIRILK